MEECMEAGIPAKGEMAAVKTVAEDRGKPAEMGKETRGSDIDPNRGDGRMDGVKKSASAGGKGDDSGFGNYNTQDRQGQVNSGRAEGYDYDGGRRRK